MFVESGCCQLGQRRMSRGRRSAGQLLMVMVVMVIGFGIGCVAVRRIHRVFPRTFQIGLLPIFVLPPSQIFNSVLSYYSFFFFLNMIFRPSRFRASSAVLMTFAITIAISHSVPVPRILVPVTVSVSVTASRASFVHVPTSVG